MQAKPNYVVALVTMREVYLYVNGEFCSSFTRGVDPEDEFDALVQDMAEMYNTEAQYINMYDAQLQAIFGSGEINMFKLNWPEAVKVLDIKPIVVEQMDQYESLSRDLEAGASADIWFDANVFNDVRSRMLIEKTQNAMKEAALMLRPAPTPDILATPLSRDEVMARMDDLGYVTGVISLDLPDLMDGIERVNDLAEEKILEEGIGYLSDISYRVVGGSPDSTHGGCGYMKGGILVEVTAHVESD